VDKRKRVALFLLTAFVALLFVVTGASKLGAVPPSPENFARWGFSPAFMYAIGAIEILGGIALLVPRLARFSAVVLIGVMLGAVKTGVAYHEALHIFLPLALIGLLSIILYARRSARS
jgi:uncharacterized membrane protein YphA (DoxX/SURF4 family)